MSSREDMIPPAKIIAHHVQCNVLEKSPKRGYKIGPTSDLLNMLEHLICRKLLNKITVHHVRYNVHDIEKSPKRGYKIGPSSELLSTLEHPHMP